MARVKNRRTKPEECVAAMLRRLGVRYRRNVRSMIGEPDFVIGALRTVVFVHGCFWHNHPGCKRAKLPATNREFWKKKIMGNRKRDARIARRLRKEGWHVITIWQCRLAKVEQVRRRLSRLLGGGDVSLRVTGERCLIGR
ncbi:MAG: DNA mismatch endonuclease Vsr [Sedimentisphaerales bacterium]|nr:DNA mismatch endonuclease Vsr [Sedimentisphaerales bacterium]